MDLPRRNYDVSFSLVLFEERCSSCYSGRASSIAIILLGSVMYTWIKHLESQQSRPASPKDTYERLPMEEVDVESEKKIDRDR